MKEKEKGSAYHKNHLKDTQTHSHKNVHIKKIEITSLRNELFRTFRQATNGKTKRVKK